jgi:ectoine hydroxylase-related dioxygenase (phytanoyl-CoA dioxygenase family)
MRHVNHIEYHRGEAQRRELWELLDAAADPAVLSAADAALVEPYVFSQMSLYFNPSGPSEDGFWHKDLVKAAPIHEWEDRRDTQRGIVAHVQIALVDSEDLEVVPGSHCRDFTPAEWEICKDYPGGANIRSNNMPNAYRAVLQPGDACVFNSITIHRGRYHTDKLRRTLMFDYVKERYAKKRLADQGGLDQYSDQPWFLHREYLSGAAPDTQDFFQRRCARAQPPPIQF